MGSDHFQRNHFDFNFKYLMFRCPDDSKARLRMCHSATKDAFKKALTGLEKEIHITERSDFDYEAVRQLMLK